MRSARTRKIRDCHRRYHDPGRVGDVERFRAEMAGAFAWRYPGRARGFGVLFPNRDLHRAQYRA